MTFLKRSIVTTLLWCCSCAAYSNFDHSIWSELLRENVVKLDGGKATQVDYDGMLEERAELHKYLDGVAAIPRELFESWNEDEQLAFLINAYNAWTVELILTEYPEIDSIRDIGFLPYAAWRRNIVALFGEQVSLDDVEHGMIRGWGRYNEPRIHFAVNCAAIGCPPLRAEAYTGSALQRQLEDNTKLFLADRSRNYSEGNAIYVSQIFDWYEEDFEQGWRGIESVHDFLADYAAELELDAQTLTALQQKNLRIRYLDYDWGLNQTGS